MVKRKRPKVVSNVTSQSFDYYKLTLDWLRGRKSIVAIMLAFAGIASIASLTTSVAQMKTFWQSVRPGSKIELSAGLYLALYGLRSSDNGAYLSSELIDLPTWCELWKYRLPPSSKMLPTSGGATVKVMAKIMLKNVSGQKLTNIKLAMAPTEYPYQFSRASITPNATVKFTSSLLTERHEVPMSIEISELGEGASTVVTLHAIVPLNISRDLLEKTVSIGPIDFRTDQFKPDLNLISVKPIDPLDLIFEEQIHFTGRRGVISVAFRGGRDSKTHEEPNENDFSVLPPPKECKVPGRPKFVGGSGYLSTKESASSPK